MSEGSLYIDVDMDSHGVVSLNGEEDAPREYMSSTGMMSSLYESTVWEELTGYESVSTISILAKAQEENVEVLLLSSLNMDTELEKLNTDEATRQTVINAVNSGKVVTIPAEEITIGNWTGTGYIVTNPETGAGEYMISGGLNGGSTSDEVTLAYMVDIGLTIWDMIEALLMISNAITALAAAGGAVAGGVLLVLGVVALGFAMYSYVKTVEMMCAYASGDEEAGQELIKDMWLNIVLAIGFNIASAISKPIINIVLKNKLVRDFGKDFIEKMLRNIDITDLGKYVKQLRKMNISDDVIREFAEKYGKAGLDWLLSKKGFGLSDDILRKLLKAGNLDDFTDDILRVIKNSDGYADDIVEQVLKYGDDAAEAIGKYGDDAVEVIGDYGDEAVEKLKDGKGPEKIYKDNFIKKIDNIRKKMPNNKLKNEGNMAIADVKISGLKSEYVAHSKINSALDTGADVANFSFLKSENERIFTTYVEVNYPRYHDTEAKILEDIASQIKDINVSGTVRMYSELPCCQSCSNIILEFKRKFPNIELKVYVE